jgi:hypothetical protein
MQIDSQTRKAIQVLVCGTIRRLIRYPLAVAAVCTTEAALYISHRAIRVVDPKVAPSSNRTIIQLSQACKDFGVGVGIEMATRHYLRWTETSLAPRSRRDPDPKSGVMQGLCNCFLSSAVAGLMACLRLVSELQVHLAIPQQVTFEARFGGT